MQPDMFLRGKCAVHVGSEHCEEFLKICDSFDITWVHGMSATSVMPTLEGDSLCFDYDLSNDSHQGLMHCEKDWYVENGYEIISFEDFKRDLISVDDFCASQAELLSILTSEGI